MKKFLYITWSEALALFLGLLTGLIIAAVVFVLPNLVFGKEIPLNQLFILYTVVTFVLLLYGVWKGLSWEGGFFQHYMITTIAYCIFTWLICIVQTGVIGQIP